MTTYVPMQSYAYTPPAPSKPKRRIAGMAATALVAGLLGGGIGAAVAGRSHQAAGPSSSAAGALDQHAQNVQLCTAYASTNASMPNPQTSALEVLPGVNALRLALAAAPDASPEIRAAITEVTKVYDGLVARFGKVRTRGLAAPPSYDADEAQRAYDQVWTLCGLDQ